ncbi:MAG: hypothetical protein ABWK05_00330 [Pyrobaculum sp.]
MTPSEYALAAAALAVGIYLIATAAAAYPPAPNHIAGIALAAFGAAYALAAKTREAAFWGGLLIIAGTATAAGGAAPPTLVVGTALVFAAAAALINAKRK